MASPERLPPAVILAGGRATRMGGGDKGLRLLGGRPLLAHVIARLEPQVSALALSANGDPARFAAFGLPVLPDSLPDHPGPLAGVLAGLDWAAARGTDRIVTAPVDTPFLPPDLVARLHAEGDFAFAAAPDGTGSLRRHPTVGLWPTRLREPLRQALVAGEYRVGVWAARAGAVQVPFPAGPDDPFLNVNRPEDLAAAESMLRPED